MTVEQFLLISIFSGILGHISMTLFFIFIKFIRAKCESAISYLEDLLKEAE